MANALSLLRSAPKTSVVRTVATRTSEVDGTPIKLTAKLTTMGKMGGQGVVETLQVTAKIDLTAQVVKAPGQKGPLAVEDRTKMVVSGLVAAGAFHRAAGLHGFDPYTADLIDKLVSAVNREVEEVVKALHRKAAETETDIVAVAQAAVDNPASLFPAEEAPDDGLTDNQRKIVKSYEGWKDGTREKFLAKPENNWLVEYLAKRETTNGQPVTA